MRGLSTLGRDGFFTLALSNVIIAGSLGVSLVLMFLFVIRTARAAVTTPSPGLLLAVLGMRLDNNAITDDYAMRLGRAVEIYDKDGSRRILTVGGVTGASKISEAEAGYDYLVSRGVDPAHVSTEDASQHTLENLRNVRALLQSENTGSFAIISNRYHLARAMVIAQGLDLNPELCAAEAGFNFELSRIPRLLLEAYYIHWYRTGSIWSHITRNKKSLARIS